MTFIGLIGVGYWGSKLLRDLDQLRAICDINPNHLNNLLTMYPNIEYSTIDFDKLLGDPKITAIVIATPSNTHFGLA